MSTSVAAQARRSARQKKQEVLVQMQGVPILGELCCWNPRSNQTHTHTSVVTALSDADLNTDVAREFLPQHAFTRACKQLSEERVIDILKAESDTITFQFTKKLLVQLSEEQIEDSTEWQYAKETNLSLNKITGKISCANRTLKDKAQIELDRCMVERTTTDITNIVQKLFELEAKTCGWMMFRWREQGGVYFVPAGLLSFTDKVERFLVNLGGKLSRLPIPKGVTRGESEIQSAVEEQFRKMVADHLDAISKFSVYSRADSMNDAAEKIKDTRLKIEAHACFLKDKSDELMQEVEKANESLMEQVKKITEERKSMPEESGIDRFGMRMGTRAAAINAAITSKPQTIGEIQQASGYLQPIHGHLSKLIKNGFVAKTSDGKYHTAKAK